MVKKKKVEDTKQKSTQNAYTKCQIKMPNSQPTPESRWYSRRITRNNNPTQLLSSSSSFQNTSIISTTNDHTSFSPAQ